MNRMLLVLLCAGLMMFNINPAQGAESVYSDSGITFSAIIHATFVIQTADITIYVDPVDSPGLYDNFLRPDIILITHTHSDHFDAELVKVLKQEDTVTIGPQEVIEQLGFGEVINNGENKTYREVGIEGIPMYNLTKERQKFHPPGWGNGYVVTLNNKRIYISGDTEDIPEMRALKDIDYVFLCMNLPYTMTVEQAASAVLEFKPRVVIPYHYRGTIGLSDLEQFKQLVSGDEQIEVVLLKWY